MKKERMNFNATWSMAVGGMVGGRIFSVLGVLIAYEQKVRLKWLCLIGTIGCGLAIIADIAVNIREIPYSIIGLIFITTSVFIFRPYILRKLGER